MLVFFAARLGRIATKAELLAFLRRMRCATVDPQPRHLGMQCGLNFLVQGCYHPHARRALRRGEYCLLDLVNAHPSAATMHRAGGTGTSALDFDELKRVYDARCACCGSRQGERHLKNAHLVTRLDRGHCDPRKPLTHANCVPMCTMCNMVYKDRAVINKRGFVVAWLGADAAAKEAAEGDAAEQGDATAPVEAAVEDDADDADDAQSTAALLERSTARDFASRSGSRRRLSWALVLLVALLLACVTAALLAL
jgi:hypothetical protein